MSIHLPVGASAPPPRAGCATGASGATTAALATGAAMGGAKPAGAAEAPGTCAATGGAKPTGAADATGTCAATGGAKPAGAASATGAGAGAAKPTAAGGGESGRSVIVLPPLSASATGSLPIWKEVEPPAALPPPCFVAIARNSAELLLLGTRLISIGPDCFCCTVPKSTRPPQFSATDSAPDLYSGVLPFLRPFSPATESTP